MSDPSTRMNYQFDSGALRLLLPDQDQYHETFDFKVMTDEFHFTSAGDVVDPANLQFPRFQLIKDDTETAEPATAADVPPVLQTRESDRHETRTALADLSSVNIVNGENMNMIRRVTRTRR